MLILRIIAAARFFFRGENPDPDVACCDRECQEVASYGSSAVPATTKRME